MNGFGEEIMNDRDYNNILTFISQRKTLNQDVLTRLGWTVAVTNTEAGLIEPGGTVYRTVQYKPEMTVDSVTALAWGYGLDYRHDLRLAISLPHPDALFSMQEQVTGDILITYMKIGNFNMKVEWVCRAEERLAEDVCFAWLAWKRIEDRG